MITRISTLFDFNPYSAAFIPLADAVLRPYEARSVDNLVRRTMMVGESSARLTDDEVVRLARQARHAYLAEALPRWWQAGKAGSGRALRATAAALRASAGRVQRWLDRLEATRRERYLADSTDVHDLERRIQILERTAVRGTY
ncbi:MAG: hypothetical protein ABI920_05695 [Casimicrobiaceae bacterium]